MDLEIATARVEHAAAVVGVEKAKKKSVEWELSRFRRRSETSGFSTPMHEQVEGLELQVRSRDFKADWSFARRAQRVLTLAQVIQAELKVAEAESKLAEARIRKEEAKRSVIALQLAEVRKEGK